MSDSAVMTRWDTGQISRVMIECGRIAMRHFRKSDIELKADHSIVTAADREVERHLDGYFNHPDKGIYLIGEETNEQFDEHYLSSAFKKRAWIVDPIDGTSPYAHGLCSWGVSIAFMEAGSITHGAILLPCTGELLITGDDAVYYGREGANPEEWRFETLSRLERGTAEGNHVGLVSIPQDVAKRGAYRGPQSVQANGSCVYAVLHLALRSFLGYIASVKLWDIAAGLAILDRMGYSMKFPDGTSFGTTRVASNFLVGPDEVQRWKLKDHGFLAADEATCDYLIANTEFVTRA